MGAWIARVGYNEKKSINYSTGRWVMLCGEGGGGAELTSWINLPADHNHNRLYRRFKLDAASSSNTFFISLTLSLSHSITFFFKISLWQSTKLVFRSQPFLTSTRKKGIHQLHFPLLHFSSVTVSFRFWFSPFFFLSIWPCLNNPRFRYLLTFFWFFRTHLLDLTSINAFLILSIGFYFFISYYSYFLILTVSCLIFFFYFFALFFTPE